MSLLLKLVLVGRRKSSPGMQSGQDEGILCRGFVNAILCLFATANLF